MADIAPSPSFRISYPKTECVYFGVGSADSALKEIVAARRHARILIVTSKSVRDATPLISRTMAALPEAVQAIVFAGSQEHTPSATIGVGARIGRDAGADCLLVVGGSSALDTAKGIALALAAPEPPESFAERVDDGRFDERVLASDKLPIYAIPSTLSGSEFTPTIGITSAKHRVKHVMRHPSLTPLKVILDPSFTAFTPERLWASTGLKLLDHCVERMLANNHNPFVDVQSASAVQLLCSHLVDSVPAGDDVVARRTPLLLALWIGQTLCTGNVGVGLSHALAHQLGAKCGVPHGIGSALLLPAVLRFNRPGADQRYAVLAAAVGLPKDNPEAADRAIDTVASLIARLGMPHRLSEMGVRREDLRHVAEATIADSSSRNNPRAVTANDIVALLETIF